jgi:hypothetical protein
MNTYGKHIIKREEEIYLAAVSRYPCGARSRTRNLVSSFDAEAQAIRHLQ